MSISRHSPTLQVSQPPLHVCVSIDQHGQYLGAVKLVLVELFDLQPLQQEPEHAQRRLAQSRAEAWTCLKIKSKQVMRRREGVK